MKSRIVLTLLFVVLLLIVLSLSTSQTLANMAPAGQEEMPAVLDVYQPPTDQIIIKYKTSGLSAAQATEQAARLESLSQVADVSLVYFRPMSGDADVLKLPERLPPAEVEQIAARLMSLADIEYAEPDAIMLADGYFNDSPIIVQPEAIPNDTRYGEQWHYGYTAGTAEGLNLPAAWDITKGSSNVVVAVLDTGIVNHADLGDRILFANGYDFISSVFSGNDGNGRDNDASDPGDWVTANQCGYPHSAQNSSWHGTHVAGTIGAKTNNGVGVAGVDWNAKILPVRVLGRCGGTTSDIADAIRWSAGLGVTGVPANTKPAKVLNLSLGGSGACGATFQNAINAAVGAGSTVVISAGNSNDNSAGYSPGNCNGIITVAATRRDGRRSYYSNYFSGTTNQQLRISAPGGETTQSFNGVLSTLNSGLQGPSSDSYAFYQGTSMAAPHVSGLVALILAAQPTYTPTQVRNLLQTTARPFPAGSNCTTTTCGAGIADAYRALQAAMVVLNYRAYLPMAIKPQPLAIALNNGNFESGRTGWTEFSSQGYDIITHASDLPSGVTPHGGSWVAWLGGLNNETSYIQQQVTVPGNAPYLAYWHRISSSDVCGYDFARVLVNNTMVAQYNLCASTQTGGWVKYVVNLSAYAGQLVALQIRTVTDATLVSSLFVDDVAFQATAATSGEAISLPLQETEPPVSK